MERRTLLTGAVGLMIASRALAQPNTDKPATPQKTPDNMSEVKVVGVYTLEEPELKDSMTLVLKALDQEKYLTIWIGRSEGESIYEHLQGVKILRPTSQDFMAELVKASGGDIESVNITLQDKIFYANTFVTGNGKTTKVDARPSDAVALAIRLGAPLFVVSDLLKPGTMAQVGAQIREQAAQEAKETKERPPQGTAAP